jgi:spermidine synthase
MAVLWHRKQGGTTYEVRSAGRSVRLYENGILHSQVHPERVFVGSVWDLLTLPALMMPTGSLKRVLMLGVGGGVVIHQLQRLLGPLDITGIELNPLHIKLAKRFFGLDASKATIVQAEAGQFVRDYDGPPFDLIVDDIFAEVDGEPARAIAADDEWCQLLLSRLSPQGALVTNFVSVKEFRSSALSSARVGQWPYASAYSFSTPFCDNIISAYFRAPVPDGLLQLRLAEHPLCRKKSVMNQLRYRARKVK